jgi:hypothetical protein
MFADLYERIMIQKQDEWKRQHKDKKNLNAAIQPLLIEL